MYHVSPFTSIFCTDSLIHLLSSFNFLFCSSCLLVLFEKCATCWGKAMFDIGVDVSDGSSLSTIAIGKKYDVFLSDTITVLILSPLFQFDIRTSSIFICTVSWVWVNRFTNSPAFTGVNPTRSLPRASSLSDLICIVSDTIGGNRWFGGCLLLHRKFVGTPLLT